MEDKMYGLESLKAHLNEGGDAEYVTFFGHKSKNKQSTDEACLSQWYPSRFVLEGIQYETAEQYMMAAKARLFGDFSAMNAILNASTPAEAKSLGRKVKGYDETKWVENRVSIVVEGNYAKFDQNIRLKNYLLGTGSSILIEASPKDRIWGTGVAADELDAQNPFAWSGLNLLGFSLMRVREILREKGNGSPNKIRAVTLALEYVPLGALEWENLTKLEVELHDRSLENVDWDVIDLAALKERVKKIWETVELPNGEVVDISVSIGLANEYVIDVKQGGISICSCICMSLQFFCFRTISNALIGVRLDTK